MRKIQVILVTLGVVSDVLCGAAQAAEMQTMDPQQRAALRAVIAAQAAASAQVGTITYRLSPAERAVLRGQVGAPLSASSASATYSTR